MSWIKMRHNLDTDPDVIGIAASLKADVLVVVGRLWKFWTWADQHSEDGKIKADDALIDHLVSLPGFCKSLRAIGWLKGRGKTLVLPNFERHNLQSAKTRALTAARVAQIRNAPSLQMKRSSVTPALPEKRREEKSTEEQKRPRKEEAIAFGAEIGMNKDSVEGWFDHFESNGWKVGGKAPMKDWRAALRNAYRRNKGENNGQRAAAAKGVNVW